MSRASCFVLFLLLPFISSYVEIPPFASDRKRDEQHLNYDDWHSNVYSAPLPRYWPPWESHEHFRFSQEDWEDDTKIEPELRESIESSFSLAFYDSNCHKDWHNTSLPLPVKFIPIYFWPGKTIQLPCIMCFKAYVSNGLPKQWRVVPLMIDGDAEFNEHETPPPYKFIFEGLINNDESSHSSPFWQDIAWLEKTARMKTYAPEHLMPGRAGQHCDKAQDRDKDTKFCKKANLYKDKEEIRKYPHLPVKPKFYQRDGKLIITHANAGVQGAYNCFDHSSRENTYLIYIVQAMMPYYSSGPGITDQSTTRMCGTYYHSISDKYWQWHFAPSYLQNHSTQAASGEFNYRDTRPNKENINRKKIVPWVDNRGETHATNTLNLDMFLQWGEWSNCTACFPYMGRRVREGHCNLIKRFKEKRINVVSKNLEHIWVEDLDYILSIEPFKSRGVRVHGGLMSYLMCSRTQCFRYPYGQCANSRLDYLYEAFFRFFGSQYHKQPFYGIEDDQWKMCMNELRFRDDQSDGTQWARVEGFLNEKTYETLAAVGGYFFDVQACSRTDCE